MTGRASLIAFWLVAMLALTGCPPETVEPRADDNLACYASGLDKPLVACRIELDVSGGRCDCEGLPPLDCRRIDQ